MESFLNAYSIKKDIYEYYYRMAWMDAKYSERQPTIPQLLYYPNADNEITFQGLSAYYNIIDSNHEEIVKISLELHKDLGIEENGRYKGIKIGIPGSDHNNDVKRGVARLPYETEVEYIEYDYDFMFNKHRVNYYSIRPEAVDQVSTSLDSYRLRQITFTQMDSLLNKWGRRRLDKVEQWDSIRKSVWGK